VYDYSFVYDSTASGTLTAYQYNSAHKKNKVKFLGDGRYQVTLGGARSSGTHGTVQVSMYGFHGGECNLEAAEQPSPCPCLSRAAAWSASRQRCSCGITASRSSVSRAMSAPG
jgi:hypothetical protein